MNRGDHVLVPVFGKPVAATVVDPVTAQGNVLVELAVPVWDDRLAPGMITRVVRAPADVVASTRVVNEALAIHDRSDRQIDEIDVGIPLDEWRSRYMTADRDGQIARTIEVMNRGSKSKRLDEHTARMIERMHGVSDATPWWRRLIQRFTRR